MTSVFEVTRGQKVLIAGTVALNLLLSVSTVWLWTLGHMPFYMVLVWVAGLLFFAGRFSAIHRFPAAVVRGSELIVYGWFGSTSRIRLDSPFEFYSTGYLISMSQGRSTAAVARYVIGKESFNELVDLLRTSMGSTAD